MTKTLGLLIGGIIVQLEEDGGGSIQSDLHYGAEAVGEDKEFANMDELYRYEAAIDVLESLILGHACAGLDILTPAYLKGVQTAVDAIANNI